MQKSELAFYLAIAYSGLILPLGFYLSFRIVTLKSELANISITLHRRIILALFPFLSQPQAPNIKFNFSDKLVGITIFVLTLVILASYILMALGAF